MSKQSDDLGTCAWGRANKSQRCKRNATVECKREEHNGHGVTATSDSAGVKWIYGFCEEHAKDVALNMPVGWRFESDRNMLRADLMALADAARHEE